MSAVLLVNFSGLNGIGDNIVMELDTTTFVLGVLNAFVLATALVIRALKTRVEVNDWNKLPA